MRLIIVAILSFLLFSCINKTETNNEIQQSESNDLMILDEEIHNEQDIIVADWDEIFDKADSYRKVSDEYSDKSLLPENFKVFVNKFISDSLYQRKNINFERLIAVDFTCEDAIIFNKSNWTYETWPFLDYIGIDEIEENTFHFSNNVFFSQYMLKEVGIYRMFGFEKIDDEWKLTFYYLNNC